MRSFLSPRRPAGEKRAITTLHQVEGIVDQALRLTALGGAFPFRPPPDRHGRIDELARDHIAGDVAARGGQHVENIEQERKPVTLEG